MYFILNFMISTSLFNIIIQMDNSLMLNLSISIFRMNNCIEQETVVMDY